MTFEVFAPAKINLTLHITGQRKDGYHLLDSLVVFADVGDRLWITPSGDMRIEVCGPFAEGVPCDQRNLLWQAAKLVGQTAHIKLEKNLPHGAGIGGGSSDAAAVLRHFGVSDGVETLGADVPVCLAATAQRMRGIGDQLDKTPLAPLHAVLVNPGIHVSTPAIFTALAVKENPPMPNVIPSGLEGPAFIRWLATGRNDLEQPACQIVPQIGDVLSTIDGCSGAMLSRMSGSGATCFGLFQSAAEATAAAKTLAADYPSWWVRLSTLS